MPNTAETVTSGFRKKSAVRISKDGKWRSFPRVPHLLQYVASETYFARVKIRGKVVRESLETTVWSVAQLKLVDFLKAKHTENTTAKKHRLRVEEAAALFTKRVNNDASMKQSSKDYRHLCIWKIKETWPELWARELDGITAAECRDWSTALKATIASQYFNNVIGTLRLIIDEGIQELKRQGGQRIENPASELTRARITQKTLKLPEKDQFKSMVDAVRDGSSWGPKAADLVEFLAYSGLRLYTEAQWVTWGDVDSQRMEIVVRGHPETRTKNGEIRRVPIIEDLETLLERMREDQKNVKPGDKVLQMIECPISLTKACGKIGIARITHHDLRHLFATRCIESGVDIPTVARWLGHKDGGALAMRTYGHLRNEHSQAMAKKVKF